MSYNPTQWKDRVIEKPNTFRKQENPDGTITLIPVPGQITQQGTAVNALSMNNIEKGIADAHSALNDIVTINLHKYNIPTDGVTDASTAIMSAIAEINAKGAGKIVAPYCNNGYAIGGQIALDYNTELDLQGSVLKPIGSFNVDDVALIKAKYSGNIVKNIIFNTSTTQYGIEFGSTSSNNLEMNCKSLAGNNYLVRTETDNTQSYLNRSLTLESISKGRIKNRRTKKIEFNYNCNANSYASKRRMRPFPSECIITNIKVTDVNGSPDFYFEVEAPSNNYIYTRARTASNIDDKVFIDYYNTSRDDIFIFGIYNYKASATQFKIEITITDFKSGTDNKVWEYNAKEDFTRPHYDSLAPNTSFSINTIRQMEYRFKDSLGNTVKLGVTPARKQDEYYQYPQVVLPTPAGVTQDSSTYSEIKFYFNYSASQAVVEKPTKVKFRFHKVPKDIKARLIVGWYSQNPDNGSTAYLKSSSVVEKDVNIPVSATYDNPYEIEVLLDHKGYQKGSALEGSNSFDFMYFVLWQKDGTYTPYLFGEEYIFNAYITK